MDSEFKKLIQETLVAKKLEQFIDDCSEKEIVNEFLGFGGKKKKREQTAKRLLTTTKVRNLFFDVFADYSIDYLLKVLSKRIQDEQKKLEGAYVLYLIFVSQGKHHGFLGRSKYAKALLNNNDQSISDGAQKAKDFLERKMKP